ncbi:MAG: hypothetical protein K8H85_03685 [Cyclobacteriaceae bacterium]|nr:hypothetical protein [Cyclobacteriaceae bacterium]
MKKRTTNFDIIKAGIRAFSKALDNQYKDRLINDVYNNLTNPVPQELQPGYANYDFKYLYFESYRKEYPLSYLDGGAFAAPLLMNDENKVTSTTANTANIYDIAGDILKIGIENDKPLNVGKVSIRDVSRIMDFYQFEHDCILAGNSTYFQEGLHKRYFSNNSKAIEDITAWVNKLETEGSLDVYGAGIARARAKAINDNCFHFSRIGKDGNQRSSRMDFYDYKRNYHTRVDVGYGTVTKGEKISEQQGQLLFSDFRGNQPTWCNDFAIRASRIIFGSSPIGGTTKNMEPDMASDPGNFVNLTNEWASGTNNSLVWSYITNGFVVYFVNENDHIEIGYDIDQKGNSLYYRTIGGGATVDRKITSENSFLQDKINGTQTRGVSVFLYLGYLKN